MLVRQEFGASASPLLAGIRLNRSKQPGIELDTAAYGGDPYSRQGPQTWITSPMGFLQWSSQVLKDLSINPPNGRG